MSVTRSRVYLTKIPLGTTENQLVESFSRFGKVKAARILSEVGIIDMSSSAEARQAIRALRKEGSAESSYSIIPWSYKVRGNK